MGFLCREPCIQLYRGSIFVEFFWHGSIFAWISFPKPCRGSIFA
jgi:hypothetical protein